MFSSQNLSYSISCPFNVGENNSYSSLHFFVMGPSSLGFFSSEGFFDISHFVSISLKGFPRDV
jgi:hypothetical protein